MKAKIIGFSCIGLIVAMVVLAIFFGRGAAALFLARANTDVDPIHIVVESGENVVTVTQKLKDEGLLEASNWFKWYGRLTGKARNIKAGEFEIYPGMSIAGLYEILLDGRSAEKEITIIEGWKLAELSAMLVDRGIAEEGELDGIVNDLEFRSEFAFLSEVPAGVDIEGYIFPETYRVLTDASVEDVLRKALDTFEERVVTKRASDIAASKHSLFEIVTIASILEREVRGYEDKRMVADLIERRLEIGMPLQMDSTVNYVTGKNRPGILLVDRDVESLYNTYKYPGLPLGPISNPGIDSINAVLNPLANEYLFFLTTPEGEVIYARSNDEHVRNKNRYLR